MKGRRPKPTHLKLVTGNPGKRKLNSGEPKPQGNLKDAPAWLTKQQKEGWRYAIGNAPLGLLKRLDRSVLVAWVVAEDLHRRAAKAVEAHGMIQEYESGPQQSPWVAILNKQAQIMMKAAADLGFSPSSRSRIQVADGEQDQAPEERFFD